MHYQRLRSIGAVLLAVLFLSLACSEKAAPTPLPGCERAPRPIVFAHGMMGGGDNFASMMMRFASNGYWGPKTKWGDDTNEDEAQAVVRFSSGVWMSLRESHIDPVAPGGMLRITGTEGTYVMNGGDYQITKIVGDQRIVTSGKNPPNEYEHYYQNVADHLVKGDELIISGEWARRPIHILDLADQSAKQGKTIAATYK